MDAAAQVEPSACECPPAAGRRIHHARVLLHPNLLHFLETEELVRLSMLNKEYSNTVKTDRTIGYWPAMCASLSGGRGIYAPRVHVNAREYFFEELWKAKSKWLLDAAVQDFKIRVSTRFRPGEKSRSKFALPLHQFLKVRQQQRKESVDTGQGVFVGENIPEHMLDALLGTIMHQPVLLQDSQRVLDRSVAVTCVLRGGKDPFTGSRLTMESLIPMPDLAAQIAEFKAKQANVDISVGQSDIMRLVEEVDPALLEALVAVEQLNYAARRAHIDGIKRSRGLDGFSELEGGMPMPGDEHADLDPETVESTADTVMEQSEALPERGLPSPLESDEKRSDSAHNDFEDERFAPRWRKAEADSARIIEVSANKACVTMNVPGTGVRPFYFNKVFPGQEKQVSIYNKYARDIVVAALNGQNGCLLCYGQTSSGKTFTMFGPPGQEDGGVALLEADSQRSTTDAEVKDPETMLHEVCGTHLPIGIVLRSCAEIMRAKQIFERRGDVSLTVSAQYVEVYSETVTDLLSGARVSVRRSNGELHGATEVPICELADVVEVLRTGNKRKHFAATAMNDRSSRAHTALVLHLTQRSASAGVHLRSALYLVDLAGSERVKKSGAAGMQMKEAKAINSSLLVLGKVINRLSRSEFHVPYFESQLTTMLKGAFGGNSRTGVIVTCRSDDQLHGDETLQSLRFGELCGMISNSTRQAATSLQAVLECLDNSINQVSAQIESMVCSGRNNIPSFHSLNIKLSELKMKRAVLAPPKSILSIC